VLSPLLTPYLGAALLRLAATEKPIDDLLVQIVATVSAAIQPLS
jgi:hypothetical protein